MPQLPQSKQPIVNASRVVVTGCSVIGSLFADTALQGLMNSALGASATISGTSNNVQLIDTNGNTAVSITSGWQGTIDISAAWEGTNLTEKQIYTFGSGTIVLLNLPANAQSTLILTGKSDAQTNVVAEVTDSTVTLGQGATPATWSCSLRVLPAVVAPSNP